MDTNITKDSRLKNPVAAVCLLINNQ